MTDNSEPARNSMQLASALRSSTMVDEKALTVDALAQEIRRVDGNHSLGAGALAEALMPFITGALSPGSTVVTDGAPAAWAEEYGGRIVSVALKEGAFHKTPLYRAILSAAGER